MNKGRNPVLPPDICVADGEAHVFGQELYIYGSRDFEKETYCSDQYNVISTKDMMHWDIHEKSFDGNDVPWIKDKKRKHYPVTDMNLKNPTHMFQNMINSLPAPIRFWIKISGKKNLNLGKIMPNQQYLFAPDCIEKDGKYFLYFCMADNSKGVAVAEKPEGPFEKPYRLPCGGIDPAIFIDDDGKAYYYWGQFRACGVPLNADMISFDAKKQYTILLQKKIMDFMRAVLCVKETESTTMYIHVYIGTINLHVLRMQLLQARLDRLLIRELLLIMPNAIRNPGIFMGVSKNFSDNGMFSIIVLQKTLCTTDDYVWKKLTSTKMARLQK